MNEIFAFVLRHGYIVLFVWVFAEQLGLPVPAIPILLAAGALAGAGKLSLTTALVLAMLGALVSDSVWYEIGRRRGRQVLNLMCRISLEPDSCVRGTEDIFARHGVRSLVMAKFLPGFSTAAPPLAGAFRMKLWRFLLYDALGSLLWAGTFLGLGYAFSDQIESVAEHAARLGSWLLAIVSGGLGAYIGWKFAKRQMFLRKLRIARIQPSELKRMMDAGEQIVIVDLRQSLDFEAEPSTIPGAVLMSPEELDEHHDAIPRDRDVVLYCT
ncbi:MAG: VTT domain-containing protein [Acidobacteria bacterium]|nr:VTT domain-containing protein [Acidobacteriota bacterium]MCL5288780.1 VTT domain-containing protein [Acidobacteriota bacterium]